MGRSLTRTACSPQGLLLVATGWGSFPSGLSRACEPPRGRTMPRSSPRPRCGPRRRRARRAPREWRRLPSTGDLAICPTPPALPVPRPGVGKTVALTFDDGPGKSTAAIISILEAYDVPATFFNIGENERIFRPTSRRGRTPASWSATTPGITLTSRRSRRAASRASSTGRAPSSSPSSTCRRACSVPPTATTTPRRSPGGRAPPGGVDVVGRHRGPEGGRIGIVVLGRPDHLARRVGRWKPAPGRLDARLAGRESGDGRDLPAIIRYFSDHGYRFVDLFGRNGPPISCEAPSGANAPGSSSVAAAGLGPSPDHSRPRVT